MKKRTLIFRQIQDKLMTVLSCVAVLVGIGCMTWILYTIIRNGFPALSYEFLTEPSKPYGIANGGIANAFLGTLAITAGAAILAIPPAVMAGIYLAEYREDEKTTSVIRFLSNVLMGVPSVIVGLFIYTLIVAPMNHFSGFAASVALAVIMFPVITRTTEDMLAMVSPALRESALALGLTRTRTTICIVCRAAKKGLLTGVLLAISRVSGETAPLLFTALFADSWPTGYWEGPTANMPVLITEYTTNSPFAAMHQIGWGAALVMALFVLGINITAKFSLREKKYDA